MQWLDHRYLGYNYRMDEMSAVLGLTQLKKLDFMIKKRREIAGWYAKYLGKYNNLVETPKTALNNTHTWFVYVVRLKNSKVSRDKLICKLNEEGVGSKPYLPSIHLFDFYRKKFGYKVGDYPVSEKISATSFALPFYVGLKEKDVKYICNKLVNILKKYTP